MNRFTFISLVIVTMMLTACGNRNARATASAPQSTSNSAKPIPAAYQKLYDSLKTNLDQTNAQLDPIASRRYSVVFAAELITADSNRGTDLLNRDNLSATILYMDRLHAMGIRGVKMSVQYPLLTPNFPNRDKYIEFYKQVMSELRKRDMVVTIQQSVIFAGTNYTTLPVNYSGLTFERFKNENRAMAQTIIGNLHPDYLVVVGEPDTAANLTGIKELNDPAKSAEFVQYVLQDLDRGTTKIGAGTGTWSPTSFIERYARDTSVDVIVLHMYPISVEILTRTIDMVALAKKYGKRVMLDESWLYKTAKADGGNNVAASEDIFKHDVYSFWQPLDQDYIRIMVKMCDALQIDFYSVFWSPFLFGYVDYEPGFEKLSYRDLRQRANQEAFKNLQSGTLSATGAYYQELIAKHK